MAKNTADLSFDGHTSGDSDGLGAARGIRAAILIELACAVAYGVLLHFGIWR